MGETRATLTSEADPDAQAADAVSHLEVRDLKLTRGSRVIFDGLSCAFPRGKITVVAGQSGSGKTTLLRILACLLRPQSGSVRAGGVELSGFGAAQTREFRSHVGMLFQGGALLDSMSVFDNVALPLRELRQESEDAIRKQVHTAFDAVGLRDVDALLPGELSGGMVKRAGLARALIGAPDLLFCDEPFSGLDPPTLRRIEALLVDLNRRTQATMIMTSHHIKSTMRMADHVIMLLDRRAVSGTPKAMQAHSDPRVADFFDEPDVLPDDYGTGDHE